MARLKVRPTTQEIPDIEDAVRACVDADGKVTKDSVLRRAERDPRMRKYLEWDDAAAGHQHRLEQAGELIKLCRNVRIVGEEYSLRPAPEYLREVDGPDKTVFVATERIASARHRQMPYLMTELHRIKMAINRAIAISREFDRHGPFEELLQCLLDVELKLLAEDRSGGPTPPGTGPSPLLS